MKTCKNCGRTTKLEARYCPECREQDFDERDPHEPPVEHEGHEPPVEYERHEPPPVEYEGYEPPVEHHESPVEPHESPVDHDKPDDYEHEHYEHDYDDKFYDDYDEVLPIRSRKPGLAWPIWAKLAIIAALICAFLLATIFAASRLFGDDTVFVDVADDIFVRVPNVLGADAATAGEMLLSHGLNFVFDGREYCDIIPQNHVFMQDVLSDKFLPKNSVVALTLSVGPRLQIVPLVEGVSEREAEALLRDVGFSAQLNRDTSSYFAIGAVSRQIPAAGQSFELGRPISLTVSGGAAPAPTPPPAVDIPNVVMHSLQDAAELLGRARLVAYVSRRTHYEGVPVGTVLSQSLPAGARAVPYTTIELEVAINAFVQIAPAVEFMPLSQAERTLHSLGFAFGVQSESSPNVQQGNIALQNPTGGSILQYGSHIALVVSTGAAAFDMPDVLGLTMNEARDILHGRGLVVVEAHDNQPAQPFNVATGQSPEPGTQVVRGQTAVVVINTSVTSIGLADVPNVVGISEAEAETRITRQGLFVGNVIRQWCRTTPEGVVISQSPPTGTPRRADTGVTLVVSSGANRITFQMPLLGMNLDDAAAMLLSNGFGVRVAYEFSQTVPKRHVINMYPGQANLLQGDFATLTVSLGVQGGQDLPDPPPPPPPPPAIHTITYNPNGATGTAVAHTVQYGTAHVIVQNMFRLSGYAFAEWNTRSDGTGEVFMPDAVIASVAEDISLYAIWSREDIAVTGIFGIPLQTTAGVALILEPIVAPSTATHQDI